MAIPKISRPYKFPRIDKKIHNRSVLAAMTNKQSYENGIISEKGTFNDLYKNEKSYLRYIENTKKIRSNK